MAAINAEAGRCPVCAHSQSAAEVVDIAIEQCRRDRAVLVIETADDLKRINLTFEVDGEYPPYITSAVTESGEEIDLPSECEFEIIAALTDAYDQYTYLQGGP